MLALALAIGGCGGDEATKDAAANVAAAENATATAAADAEPALPACPFRETEWNASVTGGDLLVNGTVDVMMAGFKPTLTRRDGAPGVFAFDLALVPEAGAAVSDAVRYEESGVGQNRRAEIWCGGDKIADIDVVLVAG